MTGKLDSGHWEASRAVLDLTRLGRDQFLLS
jgi:hypothetical protein